ncbi:WXG100 family type VII secretion target [Actinoallomurus soli]|uniref:WXG100 family type VII secretion target n=1 Tax=Actinoallomurus soli TaxID=2952535 RepID=UPI0020938A7A|nr:WXG100 family type VII secretion target [Actinoallomurus soli]MCO5975084.1 WXG100 family type VII secretion target [Actinoallomurus soli]
MSDTNYDQVGYLAIGPWGIDDTATKLQDLVQDVVGSLTYIDAVLQSLVLNDWMGKSQQEADDFNSRWSAVMSEMFGSDDKPNDGVLNAIVNGIANAGSNYNKAESGLISTWSQFSARFDPPKWRRTQPQLPDINATPPDELDTNKTAITADYHPKT